MYGQFTLRESCPKQKRLTDTAGVSHIQAVATVAAAAAATLLVAPVLCVLLPVAVVYGEEHIIC